MCHNLLVIGHAFYCGTSLASMSCFHVISMLGVTFKLQDSHNISQLLLSARLLRKSELFSVSLFLSPRFFLSHQFLLKVFAV